MSHERHRARLFRVSQFTGNVTEEAGPPMTETELADLFGRRKLDGETSVAADIGCAECPGVLYVSSVGSSGWLSFRCRVGHAFSADTLVAAKEEQLEDSLWSTIETLEELIQLYRALEVREQLKPDSPQRSVLTQRLTLAERHLRVLRDLIDSEGPSPMKASLEGNSR
jgi:two-component system chemotaxis response regulator CheB